MNLLSPIYLKDRRMEAFNSKFADSDVAGIYMHSEPLEKEDLILLDLRRMFTIEKQPTDRNRRQTPTTFVHFFYNELDKNRIFLYTIDENIASDDRLIIGRCIFLKMGHPSNVANTVDYWRYMKSVKNGGIIEGISNEMRHFDESMIIPISMLDVNTSVNLTFDFENDRPIGDRVVIGMTSIMNHPEQYDLKANRYTMNRDYCERRKKMAERNERQFSVRSYEYSSMNIANARSSDELRQKISSYPHSEAVKAFFVHKSKGISVKAMIGWNPISGYFGARQLHDIIHTFVDQLMEPRTMGQRIFRPDNFGYIQVPNLWIFVSNISRFDENSIVRDIDGKVQEIKYYFSMGGPKYHK